MIDLPIVALAVPRKLGSINGVLLMVSIVGVFQVVGVYVNNWV